MFFKLIDTIEFDANDVLYRSESIVCIIMARNFSEAKLWFNRLREGGFVHPSHAARVEEATEEEYDMFIKNL